MARTKRSSVMKPPSMKMSAINETYNALVMNGYKKATRAEHRFLFSSILSGFLVGAYGHTCTYGASKLYSTPELLKTESGAASLMYSVYFTGAFQAIIITGTDLFTSNSLYGFAYILGAGTTQPCRHRWWVKLLATLKQWLLCWIGNLAGCAMAAALFTLSTGHFSEGSIAKAYLCNLAHHKVGGTWGATFADGFGANFFVCIATLGLNAVQDGIGTLFCVMLPVMNFCMGGFQHSVANMYTLTAADLVGCGIPTGELYTKNIIPATFGNMAAALFIILFLMMMCNDLVGHHYWSDLKNKKAAMDEEDMFGVSDSSVSESSESEDARSLISIASVLQNQ